MQFIRRTCLIRMSIGSSIGGVLVTSWMLLVHVWLKDVSSNLEDVAADGMGQQSAAAKEVRRDQMFAYPDRGLHVSKESVPSLVNSQTALPSATVVLGKPKDHTVYLNIGIPTVSREGKFYLPQTLDSLVFSATADQLQHITIVVFLGDFNDTKRQNISKILLQKYGHYLNSGSLVVIQANQTQYPPLEDVANIYGDPPDRVVWRTKQVVDFYILWTYCASRSQYYLQLEDDVITVDGYVTEIRKFVDSQTEPWVCLQFSVLGFIGKLFHSTDLHSLSAVAAMFYAHHPVDFILQYFLLLSTQRQKFRHQPALFQHIGQQSSLKDKVQPLRDWTFENTSKLYHGDNPPAQFTTNMRVWNNYDLDLAYSRLPGFFWASQIKMGQYITMTLSEAQILKRVVVETGSRGEEGRKDQLEQGKMDVSQDELVMDKGVAQCAKYVYLGNFNQGRLDLDGLDTKLPGKVKCIRITVTGNQAQWLIISEIAIFVK